MNLRITISALSFLALLPLIGTITAQENAEITESYIKKIEKNVLPVYPFVQIVHRDSSGNLLTYTESDHLAEFDNETITGLMTHETELGKDYTVYQIGQDTVQVIVRQVIIEIQEESFFADTSLLSSLTDEFGKNKTALRFNHDGFIAQSGDTVTYYWNLVRFI
tara:strand:+ start:2828 stop:3319 length:492 start_codon:yes stop_codon:yes gene_type:complete